MARNTGKNKNMITNEEKQEVVQEEQTVTEQEATEVKQEDTLYTFVDVDGTEKLIKYDDIKKEEQRIFSEQFTEYANNHSFTAVCRHPKWSAPRIGTHEDGKLHVFHDEKNVNMKRYLREVFSNEQIEQLKKDYRGALHTCNAFLNNIAIDGQKVNVGSVKEAMNKLNDELMQIDLHCVNDNDEEYTLTVTNRMVRVMLVNDAKANDAVTGFKSLKILDFLSIIMTGLSKEYMNRTKKA